MKASRTNCTLLFLLLYVAAAFSLQAQQTEEDRKLFEEIKAEAEQGDAQSQCALGSVFYFGSLGVAKDAVAAVMWYRNGANQKDAIAQYNLGICYAEGQGVAKDEVEAMKWYRKAAEQNYVVAQRALGLCYANSRGVLKDDLESVKWYRKAAEQNYAEAQCNLGVCYSLGRGVAKDVVEAAKWYRLAAEQNLAMAQNELGNCYRDGEGVVLDAVEAVKWYKKAAEQGDDYAQFNLGTCYYLGRGVLADYIEAYKWNALASSQGNEAAVNKGYSFYRRELTPSQISEGQRRAAAFKPRNRRQASSSDSSNGVVNSQPSASGTGFFISDDGYLISNNHVVDGTSQVRLVTSAGFISAKVVKVDAANDLALLKAEGRFAPLPLSPSRGVKLGGTVATVGFPNIGLQGFAPKLAKGEIASLSGAGDDARYFQISVPVQPGNSGGALVDERGNVVGVVSAKLSARAALAASGALPENVNYAVKSSYLLSFLESVPDVAAKLKEASAKEKKFEEVVKEAEQAAVLVLVY